MWGKRNEAKYVKKGLWLETVVQILMWDLGVWSKTDKGTTLGIWILIYWLGPGFAVAVFRCLWEFVVYVRKRWPAWNRITGLKSPVSNLYDPAAWLWRTSDFANSFSCQCLRLSNFLFWCKKFPLYFQIFEKMLGFLKQQGVMKARSSTLEGLDLSHRMGVWVEILKLYNYARTLKSFEWLGLADMADLLEAC